MVTDILQVLVCPICHAKLEYIEISEYHEALKQYAGEYDAILWCKFESKAYPIKNNIPIFRDDFSFTYQ